MNLKIPVLPEYESTTVERQHHHSLISSSEEKQRMFYFGNFQNIVLKNNILHLTWSHCFLGSYLKETNRPSVSSDNRKPVHPLFLVLWDPDEDVSLLKLCNMHSLYSLLEFMLSARGWAFPQTAWVTDQKVSNLLKLNHGNKPQHYFDQTVHRDCSRRVSLLVITATQSRKQHSAEFSLNK